MKVDVFWEVVGYPEDESLRFRGAVMSCQAYPFDLNGDTDKLCYYNLFNLDR